MTEPSPGTEKIDTSSDFITDSEAAEGLAHPVTTGQSSAEGLEIEGLRGERDRLARRVHDWENEDGEFIKCGATSDHLFCVFHCYEPEGHTGPHHGDAAGVIFADDSGKPHGVVANPPIDRLAAAERQNEVLRAALERIADEDNCGSACWGCGEDGTSCGGNASFATDPMPCGPAVARAALEEK